MPEGMWWDQNFNGPSTESKSVEKSTFEGYPQVVGSAIDLN